MEEELIMNTIVNSEQSKAKLITVETIKVLPIGTILYREGHLKSKHSKHDDQVYIECFAKANNNLIANLSYPGEGYLDINLITDSIDDKDMVYKCRWWLEAPTEQELKNTPLD